MEAQDVFGKLLEPEAIDDPDPLYAAVHELRRTDRGRVPSCSSPGSQNLPWQARDPEVVDSQNGLSTT